MNDAPPPPPPPDAQRLEEEEFVRWYGAWEPLTPSTVGEVLAGFDRPWWVIGGWAVEAFTGLARPHGDLDISLFGADVEALRVFLGDRWTPWNMHNSWLQPFDGRFGDIDPESQLWIRRDATSPWVLDVPLTIGTPDGNGVMQWTNKRFHDHVLPLEEATWVGDDGLRYLRPELCVFIKARLDRDKDRADLEAVLPLLDDATRARLWAMVERAHPGHAWLTAYR